MPWTTCREPESKPGKHLVRERIAKSARDKRPEKRAVHVMRQSIGHVVACRADADSSIGLAFIISLLIGTHIHMYIYIYIYLSSTYMCIDTYIYIYTYIHILLCVYIYIYIYTYILGATQRDPTPRSQT